MGFAGPQLPAGFKRSKSGDDERSDNSGGEAVGPVRPSKNDACPSAVNNIGPQIPSHLLNKKTDNDEQQDEDIEPVAYAPMLPPGFKKKTIGPAAPLPQDIQDDDDDDDDFVVGPLPPSNKSEADDHEETIRLFEKRAEAARKALTEPENKPVERESWMTELPEKFRKNFGTGARTFKNSKAPAPDSGSSWTETPADRERKRLEQSRVAQEKKRAPKKDAKKVSETEQQLASTIDSYNKKHRAESLMEMHEKKRKKEESADPNQRKRFNPHTDMTRAPMDRSERDKMVKQLHTQQDRFARGSFL